MTPTSDAARHEASLLAGPKRICPIPVVISASKLIIMCEFDENWKIERPMTRFKVAMLLISMHPIKHLARRSIAPDIVRGGNSV
jgi:hypothetical protein